MRKVKKWCALLMASVMLAGTLTGCAVKWQRAGGRRRKKRRRRQDYKEREGRQLQGRHRSQRDYQ